MTAVSAAAKEKRRQSQRAYDAKHREKQKQYSKAYRARNKEKTNRASAEWIKRNPQKRRGYHVKYKYGITLDQMTAAVEKQNHRCAVCMDADPNNGKRFLAVDHCHVTGKFRGLLCIKCNTMIGMAKDSPSVLMAAARYLEQMAC